VKLEHNGQVSLTPWSQLNAGFSIHARLLLLTSWRSKCLKLDLISMEYLWMRCQESAVLEDLCRLLGMETPLSYPLLTHLDQLLKVIQSDHQLMVQDPVLFLLLPSQLATQAQRDVS